MMGSSVPAPGDCLRNEGPEGDLCVQTRATRIIMGGLLDAEYYICCGRLTSYPQNVERVWKICSAEPVLATA